MSNGGGANQTGATGGSSGSGQSGYPFQSSQPLDTNWQRPQLPGMLQQTDLKAMPAISGPVKQPVQSTPSVGGLGGFLHLGGQPSGGQSGGQQCCQPQQYPQQFRAETEQAMAGGGLTAAPMAQGLAGLGRGGDSTLVHMSPGEVGGLQQLARAAGGSLTRNPQTGLPEAGMLSSLLPAVAGAGLMMIPGMQPLGAAAIVAAEEAIRNKDWKKGLMAGIGAYGGGGLGDALKGAGEAGAESAATSAATKAATPALTTAAADTAAGSAATLGSTASQFADPAVMQMAGAVPASTGIASSVPAAAPTFSSNMSAMGQGIGNLSKPGVASAIGSQVGKIGAAEIAAPAIYEGMNPNYPPPKPTPAPKYWVPAHGYNSLYNPKGGWNPGQYVDTYPGMATGGTVSPADASMMAKYQAMMNTPNVSPAAPPPPTALNNFMSGLNTQANTYRPPQTLPPVASHMTAPASGIANNPYTGPANFFGMDMNKLWNMRNPNGRACGGIVSMMDGGMTDGPGDGVSDSIPAVIDGHQPAALAKGEFVIPARIVSELGNGSTDAGAQRLYDMMHKIEESRKRISMAGDSGAYKKLPV